MTEYEWHRGGDVLAMLRAHCPKRRDAPRVLKLAVSVKEDLGDRKLRLWACACWRRHSWDRGDEIYRDDLARIVAVEDNVEEYPLMCGTSTLPTGWYGTGVIIDRDALTVASCWAVADTADERAELPVRATLLREVAGNPWRWPLVDPAWLTPDVLSLARVAYEERERKCGGCEGVGGYSRSDNPRDWCQLCHGTGRIDDGTLDPANLAVLADALEDAGCQSVPLMQHLRGRAWAGACLNGVPLWDSVWAYAPSDAPHVRGCWAIDCLLSKR